jgi:hypothetical protein
LNYKHVKDLATNIDGVVALVVCYDLGVLNIFFSKLLPHLCLGEPFFSLNIGIDLVLQYGFIVADMVDPVTHMSPWIDEPSKGFVDENHSFS